MEIEKIIRDNDVFVFELDNVLYPEKDFFLQVYYLFGQFVEYSEQLDASAILKYMQHTYLEEGHEGIYEKTASHFGIPDKYKLNFDLLQRNVRLPLKLLLFDPCQALLNALVKAQKPIFLLVSGNPEAQLNKIRQVDWHGLEKHLTVYFVEEIASSASDHGLTYLKEQNHLAGQNLLLLVETDTAVPNVEGVTLNILTVDKLFLP